MPITENGETLLDVGCGTGAFTIKSSLRGYLATGLTWDEPAASVASRRALIVGAERAKFEVCDVRCLDEQERFMGVFDVIICCENIEHILDDRRLMTAMFACLKPGGRLLLTAPSYYYRAIRGENGPFSKVEDGGHVRRGYTRASIQELFDGAGFIVEETSGVSGFVSQKATWFLRVFPGCLRLVPWALILPFRPLIPLLDRLLHTILDYPKYCIAVEAYKPRGK
jgi:2-polyprenyl-3-methyl-5-hydroxy-6-metoxy-1,4-benzoquinol methylase